MSITIMILCILGGAASGLFLYYQQNYNRIARKISDREIIHIARENGGRITPADLVETTNLTIGEANIKVQQLLNTGILKYKLTNSFKVVYELDSSIDAKSIKLPKRIKPAQNQGISDGDIIAQAVKSKGQLSAAKLCMRFSISIEEAEKRLRFLQEKGVFYMDVNESGTILYILSDLSLLEE